MMIVDNPEALEMTIGSPCWSPVDEAVMMEMMVNSVKLIFVILAVALNSKL